jgi:hypothetical protein
MKKIFLSLLCLSLFACSDSKVAGGSTVETENSIAVRIVYSDSAPASNVLARVRPLWYVKDIDSSLADDGFSEEYETDSLGYIRINKLSHSKVSLEILQKNAGVFGMLTSQNLKNSDTLVYRIEKFGALNGKINLPAGASFAWIQLFGTDRLVKTDSTGNFRVDSLPPVSYRVRAIISNEESAVGEAVVQVESGLVTDAGTLPAPDSSSEDLTLWAYSRTLPLDSLVSGWMRPLCDTTVGFVRLDTGNFDFSQAMSDGSDLRFVDQSGSRLKYQIAYWDDSLKQAVVRVLLNGAPDIQNVRMLWGRSAAINENYQTIWNSLPDSLIQELYTLDIDDFESGDLKANMKPPVFAHSWYYMLQDTSVTAVPSVDSALSGIVEAGGGRSGYAFHWKTSSSNGHWSFLGMRLDSTAKNWEHLDSVVYYVRGSGEYSFGIEALNELSGKALFFDSLRTEWTRVRVRPSDFVAADSNGGNIGWYLVRQKVTNITFCAIGNAEIWIDDVRIYGLNRDDVE